MEPEQVPWPFWYSVAEKAMREGYAVQMAAYAVALSSSPLFLYILYKSNKERGNFMTHDNLTLSRHGEIDWDNLHGPVTIPMTNDYLFRALLQRNNKVLKALICSLLHLNISEV